MKISIAVLELKLGSSCVVICIQHDWFPDDLIYCLLVICGQIVQHSWRHFREHYRITGFGFIFYALVMRAVYTAQQRCNPRLAPDKF